MTMKKKTSDTTTVTTDKEMKGSLTPSFTLPTPVWAIWVYKVCVALTTVAIGIVGTDSAIPDELKVRIIMYLKGFDSLIGILAAGTGVKKDVS